MHMRIEARLPYICSERAQDLLDQSGRMESPRTDARQRIPLDLMLFQWCVILLLSMEMVLEPRTMATHA